jgi:hypothetical protein
MLTIPGKVGEISSSGSPLGFNIRTRQVDDDTVRVEIREQPNRGVLLSRHFSGQSEQPRRDTLNVQIRSLESNYNLNTMISVVGVIFGSGVLIQLSKLLISRVRKAGSGSPLPQHDQRGRRRRKPYSSL